MTQEPSEILDSESEYLTIDQAPWSAQTSGVLIVSSLVMAGIGSVIVNLIDSLIPIKGKGIQFWWIWVVIAVVWTPAVLGLILANYTIIRYPYLNLTFESQPPILTSKWLWMF
ncbi:MAG: hypothetical protein AAF623_20300, partial [Planctomycetota bacterium]